ncbi:tRNA (N(6)-L-threonylcarbamoyladenosine(37)-C(2))-methylthiotransferase MtaB [Anaerocolumna sp. AGMB13025]|uniref:tRNA (N(6)-L-threonylcarbamoyladenosine(37)-C(2))- methylthiotransferase MtaB n=1 Tax=Anaerocolumna sp. AGMB13025 TaxID=3039116 RepID=UPI00241D4424|nr:tRNA (N(6)-L-threonylcarbamoyladenosine(37)-C(2))-methylthiotransferase MtaB [Anaerocolumna sp. AGMB13025]WFR55093.1 tRNA (N(6)-L-threonylcarbamoyladenosine(37)-C(2))-methylthiotransferase MtaB [Anaerocolumna sp. AGMB13025]
MNIDKNQEINYKTVAFLTLGCKVNSYETEAMQKIFEDAGFLVVDFTKPSDVYVVNTCTVTNIADRKSRQMLHKARKMNTAAVVVAVGCYVQTAGEVLEQDDAVDIVIGNNKKKDIIRILNEYYEARSKGNINREEYQEMDPEVSNSPVLNAHPITLEEVKADNFLDHNTIGKGNIIDISTETEYEELNIESVAEKTRAYIKIQDGCNQFCSYCIIPYARGRVRSRAEASILSEVSKLVQKGYKEIVLTGIHLSSYGVDFDKKESEKHHLLELIMKLSVTEGLERIRLGSLEPRIITEEFAQTLSGNTKLCPHFHLSLQSGCNETLKRMNRKYSAEEYYEKCNLLRKYFVNPAITTDVIVGFPGETNEEFEETKRFLRKISFAQMHIFKYSVRKGTRAEHMPDQVREEIKNVRSNTLIELEETMETEYKSAFLDKAENILIEETMVIDGQAYQIGHNERYLKLAVKSDKDLNNRIIKGKVTGFLNKEMMFCEIMD